MNQWLKIEAVISVDTECYVPSDKKEKGEESKATKLSHTQARVYKEVEIQLYSLWYAL